MYSGPDRIGILANVSYTWGKKKQNAGEVKHFTGLLGCTGIRCTWTSHQVTDVLSLLRISGFYGRYQLPFITFTGVIAAPFQKTCHLSICLFTRWVRWGCCIIYLLMWSQKERTETRTRRSEEQCPRRRTDLLSLSIIHSSFRSPRF